MILSFHPTKIARKIRSTSGGVPMTAMLLMALTVSMPALDADETKTDLPKLQGIWKATAVEARGAAMPLERLGTADRYTLVIVGDSYVLMTHTGTMKLDPKTKAVDLAIT